MNRSIRAASLVATLLGWPAVAAASGAAREIAPSPIPAGAQALIDRHVAWLGGWPALEAIEDLELTGTVEVSGLTGKTAAWARRDGRSLVEYDLGVVTGAEGVAGPAGSEGWVRNASGQIEPMAADQITRIRRENARTFARHLRGEEVAVSVAGPFEREGSVGTLLRFDYPDGDRFELLVDPESGASEWSRTLIDGRETWTRLSEWRELSGVRFAARVETFAEHAAENQVIHWTEARANVGLADARFARPEAGARLARLPEGAAATEWMPIELFKERWIYLRGRVNGRETDLLLDSGAGMTVLDRAFAAAAGLQASGAVAARGTGGVSEAGLLDGVTIELGGLTLGPMAAAVLDLSEIERKSGRAMPVILGKELFHAVTVDVDYPGRRIRFHDSARFRYEGPGRSTELLPGEDGHTSLRLAMEGGEPVVVGLDTGQGGALTVFGHYAGERGFLAGRPLSEVKSGGVGGFRIAKSATLASIRLAGYEIVGVPVQIRTGDVGGAFDTQRLAGNLGTGILNRFRVVFDYANGQLWLEPGAGFGEPLPRDRAGLQLERDGDELVVDFVAPGSPAKAAGWVEGERVRALDSEPVGPEWWRVASRWQHAADGTPARFTMADGTERTLVLRAYF